MCPYVNEFVGVGIHVCVDGHIHADFFLVASPLMDAVQNPFGRSTDFFNCAVCGLTYQAWVGFLSSINKVLAHSKRFPKCLFLLKVTAANLKGFSYSVFRFISSLMWDSFWKDLSLPFVESFPVSAG